MKNYVKVKPRIPNNPSTLLRNIERAIKANNVQHKPAWFNAVKLIPPSVKNLRTCIASEVGAFSPQRSQSPLRRRANEGMYGRPPRIVYPEDAIRAAFYRWHPFELDRPMVVRETMGSLGARDFKDGIAGPEKNWTVTGETVVQYTTYLMSPAGGSLPRSTAYRKALLEFYSHRAFEENRDRIARDALLEAERKAAEAEARAKAAEAESKPVNLDELDAESDLVAPVIVPELSGPERERKEKPFTARWAEKEDLEVQKGNEYQTKLETERTDKKIRARQAVQYERKQTEQHEDQ